MILYMILGYFYMLGSVVSMLVSILFLTDCCMTCQDIRLVDCLTIEER
jgi:hypothetical protein